VLVGTAFVLVLFATLTWEPLKEEIRHRSGFHRVESHADAIRFAARESGQDANLLAAIMLAESGGRVDAVSPVGALGLYQLMLPTAVERARVLGLAKPTRDDLLSNPLLNARLAANYLKWLSRRYGGDLEAILVAYNAGPGRLKQWMEPDGSFAAWRDRRNKEGGSAVLAYAARVIAWRDAFAERGVIAPPFDFPPVPGEAVEMVEGTSYGPPEPPSAGG
jgi:soluble lytic murein transglycosylase-like protein